MKIDTTRFAEALDQKAELKAATKAAVAGIRVMRNRVLVATYFERTITPGGIILPQAKLDESRFQGKVGLILKMGPQAFKFGDGDPEEEKKAAPKVGQWVFYRAADTWECAIGEGASCRFVYDDNIVGVVKNPDYIW